MKKTIVALAVAAFAATSANAATVFNQDGTKVDVNGSFRALLFKAKDNRTDIGTGGSHFAFEASHNLGNGLSALGYAKVNLNGAVDLNTLYAGFKFDSVGKLTFGKRATNGDDLSLAGYNYDLDLGVNQVVDSGNKVVNFKSDSFGGFSFGLDYVFAPVAAKADPASKQRTVVVAGFYDRKFGDVGFKFNAGYSNSKLDELKEAKLVKETAKAYTVATEVAYGPVAFAIDFAQSKDVKTLDNVKTTEKGKGLLFGVKYQVNDDLKVYANFRTAKLKEKKGTEPAETTKHRDYGLGVGYKLHKNVETFVEGAKYRTKADGVSTSGNKVQVGFRVHF